MKHAVFAAYETAGYEREEIISVHRSYELARKACRKVGDYFTATAEVSDEAKKGDTLEQVLL